MSTFFFTLFQLDESVRESFDVAYSNIYAFHAAQKPVEKVVENMKVSCTHFTNLVPRLSS